MKPLSEEQINAYNQVVSRKQEIDNLEQMIVTEINEMRSEEDEFTLTPNDVDPDIWEELIVEASKEVANVDKILRNKIKNLIRKTKVKVDGMDEEVYIPEEVKRDGRNFYTQPITFTRTDKDLDKVLDELIETNENEIYSDVDKDAIIEAAKGFEDKDEISAQDFSAGMENLGNAFNPAISIDILSALFDIPDRVALELYIMIYQLTQQSTQQQDVPPVEEEAVEEVKGEVVEA